MHSTMDGYSKRRGAAFSTSPRLAANVAVEVKMTDDCYVHMANALLPVLPIAAVPLPVLLIAAVVRRR